MNILNKFFLIFNKFFFFLVCGILIDLSEFIENSLLKLVYSKSLFFCEELRKSFDVIDS